MPAYKRTQAELIAAFAAHELPNDLRDLLLSAVNLIPEGVVRQTVAAGVSETVADVTITGMAVGDEIVSVLVFATAAAIATMTQRAAGDFVPGAAKMVSTANKANNTGNQYLVTWIDRT